MHNFQAAFAKDSHESLCNSDSESTSIYGNYDWLHNSDSLYQAVSSENMIDCADGHSSDNESPRKNIRSYHRECHCFQRLHYRTDSVLRPLISGAETSISSRRASSSERKHVYDGDSGCQRVVYSESECRFTADSSRTKSLRKLPETTLSTVGSESCCFHRSYSYRSGPSWTWSWLRLFAMILLMLFSFSTMVNVGQCQSVLGDGPKVTVTSPLSNSTSISPNANISRILPGDRHNRKDRHGRSHPRDRHPSSDEPDGKESWAANLAPSDQDDRQQKLSKAAFRQLSRMAFKALISEDFQDRPLRPPDDGIGGPLGTDDGDLTVEERRQIRRQQRKLQKQRQRQLRRQQLARRLRADDQESSDGGDLLPPASDYNQRELADQQDESSSGDQNERRLPGRRRAIAIATKDSIKPDSCRTVPLKQRVRMTGCATKIVVNHFCYGQCNSFYIPKLSKKRLRAAFESCSVCRPKTYVPVAITLHCPSRNPPYLKRKIMKVKECSCMPANLSENDIPQP